MGSTWETVGQQASKAPSSSQAAHCDVNISKPKCLSLAPFNKNLKYSMESRCFLTLSPTPKSLGPQVVVTGMPGAEPFYHPQSICQGSRAAAPQSARYSTIYKVGYWGLQAGLTAKGKTFKEENHTRTCTRTNKCFHWEMQREEGKGPAQWLSAGLPNELQPSEGPVPTDRSQQERAV